MPISRLSLLLLLLFLLFLELLRCLLMPRPTLLLLLHPFLLLTLL